MYDWLISLKRVFRPMNEWLRFFKRVLRTPIRLVTNARFFLYFLLTVCFFGAAGAWIPAFQRWFGVVGVSPLTVRRNLATYVIAIAVTSLADCIVRRKNDDEGAFRLFVLALTTCAVVSAVIVLLVDNLNSVQQFSTWGTVFAGFAWLMVNDEHPDLTEADTYSAIGGKNPIG
jgi:uncharacterized membrane protein